MRNWNKPVAGKARQNMAGFLQYLWGETCRIWCYVAWRSAFYSTYEELKLDWCDVSLWWWVFTVPMRNWNRSKRIGWLKHMEFLQYLWGIETWTGATWRHRQEWVFTVPMRNWNEVQNEMDIYIFKSFYSTYEELKLVGSSRSPLNLKGFLQYLWGIETNIMNCYIKICYSFLQYLWGIETWSNV